MSENNYKLTHQPCIDPDCGSSDALSVFKNGSAKCFSCDKIWSPAEYQRVKEILNGKKAEHLDYIERLREILGHSNQWTTTWSKCCALHTVALKNMNEFNNEVRNLLYAPEEMVREMAIWALIKIENI